MDADLSLGGDNEFLTHSDLIRIFQLVPVGFKDALIPVRIAVKFFRNLGEGIAGLHLIGSRFAAGARRSGGLRLRRSDGGINRQIASKIAVTTVNRLDPVPYVALDLF
jgi:hypothetical protein